MSAQTVTPMTIRQAAAYLDRTPWMVYQIETGRLPSAMLNGRRFVAREDLVPALRKAS